jgi:hypothetical protein
MHLRRWALRTTAASDSERPQPLHRKSRRESVRQALVGRDQVGPGLNCQRHVQTVIDSPVVREGNFQSFRQQSEGRDSREITSLHVCRDGFGLVLSPSPLPCTLPQDVADLGPENIRHNKLDFAVDIALQQSQGLIGQGFSRQRHRPLYGNAGVKHQRVQRSRSSRIISSAEGNGPGPSGGRARSSASRS